MNAQKPGVSVKLSFFYWSPFTWSSPIGRRGSRDSNVVEISTSRRRSRLGEQSKFF